MLDMIALCRVKHMSRRVLLILAAVFAIGAAGQFLAPSGGRDIGMVFSILAGFMVIAYLVTRRQVLEVASAGGGSFFMDLQGGGIEKTLELVDIIESAAARYRGKV
jgi:hypothetical protein